MGLGNWKTKMTMQKTVMIYRHIFFILLIVSTSISAQDKKQNILQIDDQLFSKQEFQNIYKKNNTNLAEDADIKSPAEYMELFVNFKLKVLEAEKQGFDTVASFRDELSGYRAELAQPYLTNVKFDQEMVRTAYHRTKYERKASHLLIEIPAGSDTLTAYQRIQELRNQILAGADFNEMAFQYSSDPSAKQNKGELGFFNGGMMVFPFEDAAYKTPIGEISQPVRTRFGYHLIKVEDERESKGQMSAAHIMKRFPLPNAADDGHGHSRPQRSAESIKSEIDSLYQLLLNGANFEELAAKYSDDQYSARNGGKLQLFTESRMIPAFAQAAFALQNDGDISPVIQTPYGWHIIKRLKHIPVAGFDELKDQLTENIKKNPQISQHSRELFVSGLKKGYNFNTNEESMKLLKEKATIDTNSKKIDFTNIADTSEVLFRFADKQYTIGNFIQYRNTKGNIAGSEQLPELIDEFAADKLIELEDQNLEKKYPEFKMLMQEYHDGILLFNISEKLIWNKAAEDTLGLKEFYLRNKSKYMGDEQFKGWIISCKNIETRSLVDQVLSDGTVGKDEVLAIIDAENPGAVKIEEGTFKKGDNAVVDFYVWNEPKPEGFDEVLTYIRGDKLPPAPKPLEESRGLHVSDYQNYLEQKWIDELHKQHKIKINKKILKSIPSLK